MLQIKSIIASIIIRHENVKRNSSGPHISFKTEYWKTVKA